MFSMKYYLSLCVVTLLCALTSCEHKPLIDFDNSMEVKIEFDWSEVLPDQIPEQAILNFYTETGDNFIVTCPTDQEEQIVRLHNNVYQLLVTTGSDVYTTQHPRGILTHALTLNDNPGGIVGQLFGTPSVPYAEPDNYPVPISYAIDPIYAAIIERVECTNGERTTRIIVKPRRVTARYNVIVNGFSVDAAQAKVWGGAISGLNSSLLPGKTLFENKCQPAMSNTVLTQPFFLKWDGGDTAIATIYSFGTADNDQGQLLYLYIWSDKNSCLKLTYDVTNVIEEAPDPMNVDIVIGFNGVSNPFGPNVSDYEDEDDQLIVM